MKAVISIIVSLLMTAQSPRTSADSKTGDDTKTAGSVESPSTDIARPQTVPVENKKKIELETNPPKPLTEKVEKILQAFNHEPNLKQLKEAALAFADADKQGTKRWRRAPNISALLPIVKIAVDHDLERDETLDKRQDEPDFWGVDTDRDWGFALTAQWKLSELIFHSDEIRVWNALADRASRREAVLTLLVGYYFERRRVQVQILLEPPQDAAEMVELHLRLLELTASIDSLTGGALTAGLTRNSTDRKATR